VRKPIIGIVAEYGAAHALHREEGLSWSEIFDRLAVTYTTVPLSEAEAKAFCENGLANRAGRGSGYSRLVITARFEARARFRDLSSRVGFDRAGTSVLSHETGEQARARTGRAQGPCLVKIDRTRNVDWIGPFIRSQFLKLERSNRQEGCKCQSSS